MKTTIDIPDPLYKRVKILAVERGQTLKQVVLGSLERELETGGRVGEPRSSYWAERDLRPGFKRLLETGGLGGGTDCTEMISDERSSCDESAAR